MSACGSALALFAQIEMKNLKTAAALHRQFQRAIQQPRVQQMPVQFQLPALHRADGLLARGSGSVNRNVRHLAAPPDFMNSFNGVSITSNPAASSCARNASLIWLTMILRSMLIALQANRTASASVTTIRFSTGTRCSISPVGISVKRLRIIEQIPALQRTKAGIEMIKARIDQPQRNHLNAQPARQVRMRIQFAAKTVSRPQTFPFAVPQRIARPFKWQVRRQFENLKPLLFEPFLEMPVPPPAARDAESGSGQIFSR